MYFQRLRDLREDMDLRQEDVAKILGISQTVTRAMSADIRPFR